MTYPFPPNNFISSTAPFHPPQLNTFPLTFSLFDSLNMQAFFQERLLQRIHQSQQLLLQHQFQDQPASSIMRKVNLHPTITSKSKQFLLPGKTLQTFQVPALLPNKKVEGDKNLEKKMKMQKLKMEEINPQFNLKANVSHMLSFLIDNFGTTPQDLIEQEREKYCFNSNLVALFDSLVEKYTLAAKCREDMIRYVLRKALGYLRDSLRTKYQLSSKSASKVLCQKYFKLKEEEITLNKINLDNGEAMLNFLLPYRKNSRNKTTNNSFITEIFASEAFSQDYLEYLANFEQIVEKDNKKKFDKFVDFLVACFESNTTSRVKNYKRLPWLRSWLRTSKVIAHELLRVQHLKGFNKKKKQELINEDYKP